MNEYKNENIVKIDEITESSRHINTIVKFVSINPSRTVYSKSKRETHRVTEALVCDDTGCILLTLWDEKINDFKKNELVYIENGYVNLFRGNMRLNIGYKGRYRKVDEAPFNRINVNNNLSKTKMSKYPSLNQRSRYSLVGLQRLYLDRPTLQELKNQ